MQFLRRNWRVFGLQAVLGCLAIGLVLALATMRQWLPVSAYAQEQAAARQIDPAVYSGVQAVRRDLALTNADLAAMGLTRESAERVLTDALDWYEANRASILERDQAIRAAKRQLSEAYRLIHVGPRNESLMSSVSGLESDLAAARASRDQYLNGLVSQIEARLSVDQRGVWQTARANRDTAGELRYVSGLTDGRVGRSGADAPAASALTIVQQQEAAAARESQRLSLPSVLAAEAEVLPLPLELREPDGIGSVSVESP